MKKNLKNIIKKNYFPFIILFIGMFILHIFMNTKIGDYSYFKNASKRNLFEFLLMRYNKWSSRLIIETVLINFVKFPTFLWKTFNISCMVSISLVLSKLFNKSGRIETNYIIVFLILMYNLLNMSSAGWYATTINYSWPLLAMLICFLPIKNYIYNIKEKWYSYILYIISVLYACNQEQTACIVCGFYILFVIYMLKNRKINKFLILMLFLSIASLIFILTCPGNLSRNILETNNHFPLFSNYNIVQKINLGVISMTSIYVFNSEYILLFLSILIVVITYINEKKQIYKFVSMIPLLLVFFLNYFRQNLLEMYPFFEKIYKLFLEDKIIYNITNKNLLMHFSFFIGIALFGIIIISLLNINRKEKNIENRFLIPLIFFIGFASRFILGFSSTVFISGARTNIFFSFSMIIVSILLWNKYISISKKEDRRYLFYIAFCLAFIQYTSLLYKIHIFG